jgi:hypothetical protein
MVTGGPRRYVEPVEKIAALYREPGGNSSEAFASKRV